MSPINSKATEISLLQVYTAPGIIVGSVVAWLFWLLASEHHYVRPELLVSPMVALFTLTALVWLIMVVVRNVAVIRGHASLGYFADYKSDIPADDRFERPARTFNNLMQVPTLFYVICLLMLVVKEADNVQIALAWAFCCTQVCPRDNLYGGKLGAVSLRDLGVKLHHSEHSLASLCDGGWIWLSLDGIRTIR